MEQLGALEATERAAMADFYTAAPQVLATAHGIETIELPTATCVVVRSLDNRMFNRAVGLGTGAPADDDALEAIAAFYRTTPYVVALPPFAQPDGLEQRLTGAGFTHDYAWMRFSRPTEDEPPAVDTDLDVRLVGGEGGRDFAEVVVEGYGFPRFLCDWIGALPGREGWRCYVAYDGDRPAGAAALFLHGETGWLGFAATAAEMRRRGAQNALLAARIEVAREAGCTRLTTETGALVDGRPSNSYRNILRSGFAEEYLRPNLRAP